MRWGEEGHGPGLGKEMARSGFQEGRWDQHGPHPLWMVRNWGTWATVSPLKVAAIRIFGLS